MLGESSSKFMDVLVSGAGLWIRRLKGFGHKAETDMLCWSRRKVNPSNNYTRDGFPPVHWLYV